MFQQSNETPAEHGGLLDHVHSVARPDGVSSPGTEVDEFACSELHCRWPVRFRLELRVAACCYALAIVFYQLPWQGRRDLSGTAAVLKLETIDSSQGYQVGTLRWSAHPNLCIDATDHQFANGTSLQLWTCVTGNIAQQLIFPKAVGKIRWAKHPDFCLDPPDHKFRNGSFIQLWKCLPHSDAQNVLIPKEGRGMIRWFAQPTQCLDIQGGSVETAAPGVRLQMWRCTKGNTNQQFVVFNRKKSWQPPVTTPPDTQDKSRLALPQCSCSLGTPTGPSLFCWFIGASSGSGLKLMKNALKQKASIFACDRHTMFSDKIVPLSADGKIVTTSIVSASVGDWAWGKRIDTKVFMVAWRIVIEQAIFKETSWTVKVNAETYFCPDRLRSRLVKGSSADVASYMRTPVHPKDSLEVYSKKAVEVYAARSSTDCGRIHLEIKQRDTDQDCVLAEQDCSPVGACLRRLGVVARMDHDLLLRDSCENGRCQPLDPRECGSCQYSAFHPLMSPANYSLCHVFVQSEG